ncbi:VOC family protein [Tessaracoccus sp. ZS01]|uniref:VOC family protein n=1 Tax=Tessaracoccus sp. ZS01 TaxID=1906324 RepID=UPI00096C69D4|nr:VOC family protein [Tessaracoccus sp. ZS01]MCG6567796.1 glyoxalase [Tessaracoccus sp. ZS01]OMG55532.1 glyoxalase [Tessaracoccus sp. ZS01]
MPRRFDFQVTFDCADPLALGQFWCEVLGYVREAPPEFDTWEEQLVAWGVPRDQWNSINAIIDPDGVRPRVFFQRVPEGKVVKNRLHLDVRVAPGQVGADRMDVLEAECGRLVDLGARRVRREEPAPDNGDAGWIVMQDPEGNEFCLD